MDDDDHDYDDETADGQSLRLSDDGYMYVTHIQNSFPSFSCDIHAIVY